MSELEYFQKLAEQAEESVLVSIDATWTLSRFRFLDKPEGKAILLPRQSMDEPYVMKFFPRGRVQGSEYSSIMIEYPSVRNDHVYDAQVRLRIFTQLSVSLVVERKFVASTMHEGNYWWIDFYKIADEKRLMSGDGSLTIDCLMTVDPSSARPIDRESPFEYGQEDEQHRYKFYGNLLGKKDFSDVVVVMLGGLVVYAHKVVLAAASPVLEAVFRSHKKMHNLRIYETRKESVVQMLYYVYTGRLKLCNEVHTTIDLLKLALAYKIAGLKTICETRLIEHLDNDNCIVILQLCTRPEIKRLREAALDFVVKNNKHLRSRFKEIRHHGLYVALINRMI